MTQANWGCTAIKIILFYLVIISIMMLDLDVELPQYRFITFYETVT